MDQEIEIEYTVEEKDFIHFRFSNLRPKKFKIVFNIIIGIIVLSSLLNVFLWNSSTNQPFHFSQISPIIFMLLFFGILYFRTKQLYKNNTYFNNPMKMKLSQNEINFNGEGYDMRMDWSKIFKVEEKNNYYLFYTSQSIANLVSKNNLSTSMQSSINQILEQIPNLKFVKR